MTLAIVIIINTNIWLKGVIIRTKMGVTFKSSSKKSCEEETTLKIIFKKGW